MSEDVGRSDQKRMDLKDAIRRAKQLMADLLEGEAYSQLGLEEVRYNNRDDRWEITLGLNRSWNIEKQSNSSPLSSVYGSTTTTSKQVRTYKKIYLNGATGDFISMEGVND